MPKIYQNKSFILIQQTTKKLSKNDNIIMKQDKGPGVAVTDKSNYHEKYLLLLYTCYFKKLDYNPTKTKEEKIQKILQNLIKTRISTLYPNASCPSKFYGTVKVQKLSQK